MLQSVTECYRVFLAHLLGPIFGLVSLTKLKKKNTAGKSVKISGERKAPVRQKAGNYFSKSMAVASFC